MISYSRIGHFGRLGNQLFQFAGTIGIARKLGYEVKFPIENVTTPVREHFSDGKTLDIVFDIPKVFNIPSELLAPRADIQLDGSAGELGFHFDKSLFSIKDSTDLSGYLQTDKYFAHVEDEMRSTLTFHESIQSQANAIFPKLDYPVVGVHLRRGDYQNQQQFHPVCGIEYYAEAFKHFQDGNYYILVFSDDIQYCEKLFGQQENLLYSKGIDPYLDLCLMSICDHNIIANSSFSWWGAWLNKNPNKRVIAPKRWFGPAYSQHELDDLYCKNWIKL
jgi:hypothetical protein